MEATSPDAPSIVVTQRDGSSGYEEDPDHMQDSPTSTPQPISSFSNHDASMDEPKRLGFIAPLPSTGTWKEESEALDRDIAMIRQKPGSKGGPKRPLSSTPTTDGTAFDANGSKLQTGTDGNKKDAVPISKRLRQRDASCTPDAHPRVSPTASPVSTTEAGGEPMDKQRKKMKPPPRGIDHRRTSYRGAPGVVVVAQDDQNMINKDFCEACKGVGEFLCCESCPNAFHFDCVDPPMTKEEVKSLDVWYCRECLVKKNPQLKPPRGIFQGLLDNLQKSNPKTFELPVEIKNYFRGVGANKWGDYVSTKDVKQPRYSKNGLPEDPDYLRLKDRNGRPIICFQCKKSALSGPIVQCDFCPLAWHLDCTDPPMATPPNPSKKWMCPNHSDHIMPKTRKRKTVNYVTPVTPLKQKNFGNIEIINEDTSHQVDDDTELAYGNVIYRLPEQAIKLNFLNSVKSHKRLKQHLSLPNGDLLHTYKRALSSPSSSYGSLMSLDEQKDMSWSDITDKEEDDSLKATEQERRQWLDGLALFEQETKTAIIDDANLRQLVKAALGNEEGAEAEVSWLKAIRQLMQIKGEDALLKFLSN